LECQPLGRRGGGTMISGGLMRRMVARWRLFRLRRRLPAGARAVVHLDPARLLDRLVLARLFSYTVPSLAQMLDSAGAQSGIPDAAVSVPVRIISVSAAGVRVVSLDKRTRNRQLTLAPCRVVLDD